MNAILFSAIFGVVMMFSGIVSKNNAVIKNVAIVALLALLALNITDTYGVFSVKFKTDGFLNFSKYGLFFNTILIAATLIYILLSGKALESFKDKMSDCLALIFFVLCGASILTAYENLLMLFIGVEVMTIPLYILAGADKRNLKSNEAALKYFLMGSFSTGIMLMGIALIYGISGSFSLEFVAPTAENNLSNFGILLPIGLLFLFMSMAFKVSAAPFHFWTPDVYDGTPTIFTSFMSTIVKAAAFAAFVQLFAARYIQLGPSWKVLVPVVIIATLLFGNITAVFQQSVKRMLAYSSIAQAGFMLFALYGNNEIAKEGLLLYAAAYSLATIGIFSVLTKVKDVSFEGFNGLAKQQPVMAFTATICLLSLAGIPLTAGFFAKYYMLTAAVAAGASFWLVGIAVVFAAVSVYYYFKVIQAMYFKEGTVELQEEPTPAYNYLAILLCVAIVLIGIFPNALLKWLYF